MTVLHATLSSPNYSLNLSRDDLVFVKRRLIGVRGKPAIKNKDEIARAFRDMPSALGERREGAEPLPESIIRDILTRGLPYLRGKRLKFTALFDEGDAPYRVELEDPSYGWEPH